MSHCSLTFASKILGWAVLAVLAGFVMTSFGRWGKCGPGSLISAVSMWWIFLGLFATAMLCPIALAAEFYER